ncbi:hypothetical protein MPSEU_000339400 [Mayamaea pseudoterrestris]|nr:hypothetical protein MPSEU_000339400 [Mayamaea pseudoterrestris]
MSAYAAPGVFPPLEKSFHNYSLTHEQQQMEQTILHDETCRIEVTVQDARIDTATLIHALLLDCNQQRSNSKHKRRPRSLNKTAIATNCPEDDAVEYELTITGLPEFASTCSSSSSATCKRSLSQIVQLYQNLLDEEEEKVGCAGERSTSHADSRSSSSIAAPRIPSLPRLQDQENCLFPVMGKQERQATTGIVGRGLVMLQELLRSQIPHLQDWLDQVVRVVDPSCSMAWKQFLRNEPDVTCWVGQSLSRGPFTTKCDKLGAIEESETEYDCEDDFE